LNDKSCIAFATLTVTIWCLILWSLFYKLVHLIVWLIYLIMWCYVFYPFWWCAFLVFMNVFLCGHF